MSLRKPLLLISSAIFCAFFMTLLLTLGVATQDLSHMVAYLTVMAIVLGVSVLFLFLRMIFNTRKTNQEARDKSSPIMLNSNNPVSDTQTLQIPNDSITGSVYSVIPSNVPSQMPTAIKLMPHVDNYITGLLIDIALASSIATLYFYYFIRNTTHSPAWIVFAIQYVAGALVMFRMGSRLIFGRTIGDLIVKAPKVLGAYKLYFPFCDVAIAVLVIVISYALSTSA